MKVGTTGSGADAHPAVFFGGAKKFWNKLVGYYQGKGKSATDAQKLATDAEAKVVDLLTRYEGVLAGRCDTVRVHLAAGKDIQGNSYAP
ncbi:hypothetical protein [Nannocystis pusilla]|uniref:hypothetical protein n=1 Tax=Nannocystis pusilla TaxID=889268 RepID=UPI003B77EC7B